jgi:predicted nucleotidyltransferase
MLDIEKVKDEIVNSLLPLEPNKIILFGSYADGTANEDSDLDLFLIKDEIEDMVDYEIKARKKLRNFIFAHDTNGIDILSASNSYLNTRDDFFYKDILENGKVLYERSTGN